MTRIYHPELLKHHDVITLPADSSHHLIKVLRCKVGEPLQLFDGKGASAQAAITALNKRNVEVKIQRELPRQNLAKVNIHIGIGISKGDRMDTVMQKCTELGVSTITPLVSQHVAFKLKAAQQQKKLAHWQKIIINACEQSGQNILMQLAPVQTLYDWISEQRSDLTLCLDPFATQSLHDFSSMPVTSLSVLIGPEGGLSQEEVIAARHAKFHTICLGPRILRTETAPISIASIAQYLWGDL